MDIECHITQEEWADHLPAAKSQEMTMKTTCGVANRNKHTMMWVRHWREQRANVERRWVGKWTFMGGENGIQWEGEITVVIISSLTIRSHHAFNIYSPMTRGEAEVLVRAARVSRHLCQGHVEVTVRRGRSRSCLPGSSSRGVERDLQIEVLPEVRKEGLHTRTHSNLLDSLVNSNLLGPWVGLYLHLLGYKEVCIL